MERGGGGGAGGWAAATGLGASATAHRPGLDGLRALAVAAVVLFHLGRLPGGNLGVDMFFVLSGWLITWKLLDAAAAIGFVPLCAFWAARLRRLMPASLVVLLAVALVWPLAGIRVPQLAHDLRWAAAWLSNWGTIGAGGDYWARFGEPSPITHFWSLAVEEQFYVAWPLVVAGVLLLVRRRHPARVRTVVAAVAGALAAASVVHLNLRFHPATPSAAYLDTFARAHSLLIGAAAGALTTTLPSGHLRGGWLARRLAPGAAGLALGIALVSGGSSAWLFRWGFPLFAAATVVVVVAAADGWGRVLATAPLRWLGDRSYALYLWHWPVILFLRPPRIPFEGPLLDLARVALSLVLADVSLRVVEAPVRSRRRLVAWRAPLAGGLALTSLAALTIAAAPPGTSTPSASVVTLPPVLPPVAVGPLPPEVGSAGPQPDQPVAAAPAVPTDETERGAVPAAAPAAAAADPVVVPLRDGPVRVLVAGDSTALQLAQALIDHATTHPDDVVVGTSAFPGCGLTAAPDGRLHEFTDSSGSRRLVDLSGCTAAWDHLPQRVVAEQIDVVLLEVGPWDAVDIHLPDGTVTSVADPQGIELVRQGYGRIIGAVQEAGASVLVVRPPDVDPQWGRYGPDPLADRRRTAALRQIVDGLDVARLDLPSWLAVEGLEGPEGRPDGVHLSPEANALFVAELVAPMLVHLGRLRGVT